MIKFEKIINFIQSPSLNILYKKYINPLKEVKQEKNPLKIISCFELLSLFAITKPKNNDPIIETIKLSFIKNLKKVAVQHANRI
tara:strand:- start:193 stop:444 length:252 start_codon:yes stop_codon:yes gene_type:complete